MAEEAPTSGIKTIEQAMARFKQVTEEMNYKEQAQFYLNAFWVEHSEHKEDIWNVVQVFAELDVEKFEGHSLDEVKSARLLELIKLTMTALERRACLKNLDVDKDKRMSALEFCLWRYKEIAVGTPLPKVLVDDKWVLELMKRPQGTNEALKLAQKALKEVEAEIQKIEDKKKELEAAAAGSGVKGMRAKNELAQLISADPTELNKAIVTAQAAVRKAQKSKDVSAQGTLWWLGRELEEAEKYKPKGGLKK